MILLAIDPGFERLGIAIIEKQKGQKEVLRYSECFHTSPKEFFEKRLVLLGEKVRDVVQNYHPELLSIETLFLETNQKTGMHVAEARGVVLYECARAGMQIVEYSPLQIKLAVTGYGKSDKKQVMAMVPRLIALPHSITSDDELDAIAIGLTAIAYLHL